MKRSDGGPPYRKEADDGRELETDHDHASQGGEPGPGGRRGTVQQARRARASRVIREHGVTMETLMGMGDAQVRERWFVF